MSRPCVLLADDHLMLVDALKKILEPYCEVVGSVGDGLALLKAADKLRPDIIVLDIAMPVMNGFEAGLRLRQKMPQVKLIFLSMNDDPDLAAEAIRCGASGYLLKGSAGEELIQAIEMALRC